MTKDIVITSFSNPTSEGVTLQLNKPAKLKTGTGYFTEFWISWDKIGQSIFEDYTEEGVNERLNLRNPTNQNNKG